MRIQLRVNGRSATVDVDPATPLLYVLRNDLRLDGPKFGCGLGQCGACTVIAGGNPIRSCITPVSAARAKEILTLEGLGTLQHPDREGLSRQEPQSNRRTDSTGASRRTLQVRDASGNHPGREARGPTSSQG